MNLNMWLDEKTQVIYQNIEGPIDDEDSQRIVDMITEFKKKLREPDKVRILAISETAAKPTPRARRLLMKNTKRNDFYRIAIVGNNPYMRAVFSFFLIVSGSNKIRLFANKNDALDWLVT
jgi:hypothetical protein